MNFSQVGLLIILLEFDLYFIILLFRGRFFTFVFFQCKDIVKCIDGPHSGRQGEIKHLYRNFAFLHSRNGQTITDFIETN